MPLQGIKYRTSRPLKISVLGATGVGKTSIALQYITNQVGVETVPTKIEDVFRKEACIRVTDEELLQKIRDSLNSTDASEESLLEDPYGTQKETIANEAKPTDISFSLKITDTAGYTPAPKESNISTKGFLSRITLKRNKNQIFTQFPTPRKRLDGRTRFKNSPSVSVSVRAKDRHVINMLSSDGVVLVYNVLDEKSFVTAQEIRNQFVQLHLTDKKNLQRMRAKSNQGGSKSRLFGCCRQNQNENLDVPPIYLIGTHCDVRAENILKETSSFIYDVSFLRSSDNKTHAHHGARKRKVVKSPMGGQSTIHVHDVYPVISEWKECVGFAEISPQDTDLVEQIFAQLNLAIITPKTK